MEPRIPGTVDVVVMNNRNRIIMSEPEPLQENQ